MIFRKITSSKLLRFVGTLSFLIAGFFIFLVSQPVDAANTCGFNAGNKTGNYNVLGNCNINFSFGSGFDGIDSGDLTIAAGKQIVIGSNAALVISPNNQLIIDKPSHPNGAIVLTDSTSQIVKGSLCAQDADGDGYADKTAYSGQMEPVFYYATDVCPTSPVNYIKKNALNSLTQLDCVSNNSAIQKIDCVKSRVYSSWTNVGTCGQYTPGIQVRTRTWTATIDTEPDCGGAACGSLSGSEDDYTLVCGTCAPGATRTNYCGDGACASSQVVTCRANGTWPTDCTPGTAETDSAFCSRLGKNCDLFMGIDNCLASRTANCGSCVSPQTCGGSGTLNVCSCTDTTWTPAENIICTPATGGPATFTQTSNCGATRQSVGTQVCCLNGYRDYDKDGYGGGASGCYVPNVSYNIVSNADDCNDSDSNIYPGRTVSTFCGIGSCGGSGTDTCAATGGDWVHTVPCATSAAACCEANGTYKAANTLVGTCQKCTGSSSTAINQTSSEDLGNKCATGAAGSATACQANNCSGLGDYCAYVGAGTSCRTSAGVCDSAETCTGAAFSCPIDSFLSNSTICSSGSFNNPASGSCQRTAVDTKCSGTAAACNGATVNRYENAATAGNVWNGSAWAVASASNNCSLSTYLCSAQQIYQNFYGCNTSGSCDNVTSRGSSNGASCGGGENSRCVAGSSSCANNCSNGLDDDGDGFTDSADPDCGAVCTSGDCCNTVTGQYKTAGTLIGTCKKCTGTSNTSVFQTALEDIGNNCATGAAGSATSCQANNCSGTSDSCGYVGAGTTCRTSAGVCDSAETCNGSSFACTIDSFLANSTVCASGSFNIPVNGSCQRTAVDTKCSGIAAACNGSTTNRYDYAPTAGNVWNGTAWAAASVSNNCGLSGYLCSAQQIYQSIYGCNTSGSCDNVTSRGSSSVDSCGGGENSRCLAGSSSCANNCSNGLDDDGDGYTDNLDSDCVPWACTMGDCCDLSTHQYKAVNTPIGTCMKCTGSSNTSVAQTSSQDLGNNCSTGAAGSATSCQSNNCSGSGDYCGYVGAGNVCRPDAGAPGCDVAEVCSGSGYGCPTDSFKPNTYVCSVGSFNNPASGSCQRAANDMKCSGTSNACTNGPFTRYENAPTAGNVWNGSAWVSASGSSVFCGISGYLCSGQQIYYNGYGCNTNGACNTSYNEKSVTGASCTGAENSRCVAGNSSCVNNCSNSVDDDSNGYTDLQDANCGGSSQCTSGDCCNTVNGSYLSARSVSTCKKCTGSSNTSVLQSSSEDLGNNCTTGGAGSPSQCKSDNCSGSGDYCGYMSSGFTCRTSAGVCDPAETCTGSAYSCPIDAYSGTSVQCATGTFNNPGSGSCQRMAIDQYCSGDADDCSGSVFNRYQNAPVAGQVWDGSSWSNTSCSLSCSNERWCGTSCPVAKNSIFNDLLIHSAWAIECPGGMSKVSTVFDTRFGCNTSGSCDTGVIRSMCQLEQCSGACYNGNCTLCYPGQVDAVTCNQTGSCAGAERTCLPDGSGYTACSILPDNSPSYHPSPRNGSFDWNCDGVISLQDTSAWDCFGYATTATDWGISFYYPSGCDGQNRHYDYNGVSINNPPFSPGTERCATGNLYPYHVSASNCGTTVGVYAGTNGPQGNPFNGVFISPMPDYFGFIPATYCSSNYQPAWLTFAPKVLNCR